MKRRYYDTCAPGVYWPASQQCEHCDGESSSLVRVDDLRGRICPVCDDALDEMFEEGPYRKRKRTSALRLEET